MLCVYFLNKQIMQKDSYEYSKTFLRVCCYDSLFIIINPQLTAQKPTFLHPCDITY